MLRKTKIIATLGPATEAADIQRRLIDAGTNVFRLNMSHATHQWVREMVAQLRLVSREAERDVAILMDLQGPAIRTGELPEPLDLKAGEIVEIRQPGAEPKLPLSTTVNYPNIGDDLKVNATVLVDNGVLQFHVLSKDPERVTCRVVAGGLLGSRRHVNLPGTRVNLPPLTERDLACLPLAAEIGVDFVGMSFVRDAAHVRQLKSLLAEKNSTARVVAKIEDQSAVTHIDEIILASDAIMVARGDLGIEMPIEELPIIQRRIVHKCVHLGRKVIVATHMLESMISNPVPTRAEMTDAANAVFEQADAIMLSGETSVGKYPVRCVEILDRIARRAESVVGDTRAEFADLRSDKQKIVNAAVTLANSINGAMLIVFTQRGIMAEHTAHLRPAEAPIFAFSPNLDVARSLHLSRAVDPYVIEFYKDDPRATIESALRILRQRHFVRAGDPIIIISDVLQGEFVADSVLFRRV
ncbi:MAG: pyruvate kinase [Verrucomicrobiales bacterium]